MVNSMNGHTPLKLVEPANGSPWDATPRRVKNPRGTKAWNAIIVTTGGPVYGCSYGKKRQCPVGRVSVGVGDDPGCDVVDHDVDVLGDPNQIDDATHSSTA
jgi:hypothetical protein